MDLAGLRALATVASTGSLAAASRALFLSPAAVHKQLKQLEYELGIRLYEKTGRAIRMSAAAEILIPYAESALAQVEAGRQAIEEWRGLRRGLVRLGTGPTLSSHWLPGILQQFRARYPSIQLTVETGASAELLAHARRGEIDMALLLAESAQEEPGFEMLARWKSKLVAVTGIAEVARARRLKDLARVPFISFRRGSRLATLIDRFFARYNRKPDTVMRFDNADSVRAVLRTGFGYGLLPSWTLTGDFANRHLFPVPLEEQMPVTWVELVRHAGTPLSPAAREFIEIAKRTPLE
jgi:LysR family cyn operon transcriptional activator